MFVPRPECAADDSSPSADSRISIKGCVYHHPTPSTNPLPLPTEPTAGLPNSTPDGGEARAVAKPRAVAPDNPGKADHLDPVGADRPNARAFVEAAGDPIWGFEGPTTAADEGAFYIMGVKISMANTAFENTPIPALADPRAYGLESNERLCGQDEGCSWREVNPLNSGIIPDDRDFSRPELVNASNWFGQQISGYEVQRGDSFKGFKGSLPNFITKMTAGFNKAVSELEPMTTDAAGTAFVEDSFIFEPRENVVGGKVVPHDCDGVSFPVDWGVCLDGATGTTGSYYTVNEVVVVCSTLRGFPTVTEAANIIAHTGQDTTFIGHFIKDDSATESDKYQGLFYIREEEFEAGEPVPVSIYEGPITSLSPAGLGPPKLEDPETWNVMWIMGCPVHIHPDLILVGPTIEGEPIRGANLLDLLDTTGGRGHALKLLGATGKGVAERLLRIDGSGAEYEIYVMQEIVVELAENVIIYPDANDAYFDEITDTLKLFPNGVGGFQMKVKISEDANFPGHWLDAGGKPLGNNSITALNNALANAPDKSLGLGGFFSISDPNYNGIGEDTGTFYVVEGETTAPPAELPAVLINRYNLRYDSNDNEARMEIRGQYVSDKPIEGEASVSLEMKHVDGVGAFPCTDNVTGSDCLVSSALGIDFTGSPGKIARPLRRNRRNPIRRNRCDVNLDAPNTCNFRISLRENVEVLGLAKWPDYHSPLMLQYIADVFKIEVTARNSGTDTKTEATPGRIRVD